MQTATKTKPDLIDRFATEYGVETAGATGWRTVVRRMADLAVDMESPRLAYLLDTCAEAPTRDAALAVLDVRTESIVCVLGL